MQHRSRYAEREAKQWADAVGGAKRRWLIIVVANAALVAGLLGGAALRGQTRARSTWQRYDRFAKCLYGHETPRGSRPDVLASEAARYATRVLATPRPFTKRCAVLLAAIAPSDDIFVLTSLKRAEAQVREAVRVASVELGALKQAQSPSEPISLRPLRALLQLRQVLDDYDERAGSLTGPASPERQRETTPTLPAPGRVPLYAGADAVVSLWGNDSVLRAVALDRTGLSYLSMSHQVDTTARFARPRLLRDFLLVDERVILIWGTAPERCRQLGGCIGKTTGIAAAMLPLTQLPTPRWLEGHLAARADRSMALGTVTLALAAESEAGAEVRTFPWASAHLAASLVALPPLAASDSPAPVPRRPLLLTREDGAPLALTTDEQGDRSLLFAASDGQRSRPLAVLPRRATTWVTACYGFGRGGFSFGTESELLPGEFDANASRAFPAVALATERPVHTSHRGRDRVHTFCLPDGVMASVLDRRGRLMIITCSRGSEACTTAVVATGVDHYAALVTEGSVLFAYAGKADGSPVRVRSVDWRGSPMAAERIPAACFAPTNGMCGAPVLARLGRRVVLAAQNGTDLVALESPDLGRTWQRLHGAEPSVPHVLLH